MGFAEKRNGYWSGRYKAAPGKYPAVTDDHGQVVRFRTKREAKQAADRKEATLGDESRSAGPKVEVTFAAFASGLTTNVCRVW
jgi:hypothetical protein